MQIKDYVLSVEGFSQELPHLPRESTVRVWAVPNTYRAGGYFVSVQEQGEPVEIPACSPDEMNFVGAVPLPANETALFEQRQKLNAKLLRMERDRLLRETYDPAVNQLRRKIDEAGAGGEGSVAELSEKLFAWHEYANALENLPEQEGFPWDGPGDVLVPWPVRPE